MSERINWSTYALKLAFVASERSEDPYLRVGCCVLRHDKSVAGLGYNGAPPNIEIDWTDRDDRRKRVIHAEVNALRYTRPGECSLLACTHLPCNECLRMIASYGVEKVVYNHDYDRDLSSKTLSKEFGMELTQL